MRQAPLLLPLLAPLTTSAVVERTDACRCRPHEPCWPSQDTWTALNASMDGVLHAVKPVGTVCHDPTFNGAACAVVQNMTSDSLWRVQQPGAVQWTNWEAWTEQNETCYLDLPRQAACKQGRVSLYSAVVEKVEHIQAAVKFAAQHNLRLAIKNTGHDFLGRSSAPDSLQISTFKMNTTKWVDDFYLTGSSGCSSKKSMGSAVTIGAGARLQGIYAEAAAHNKSVIIGLSHTVGAAGGYMQGGGHSPLGPWKGMAVDNALEFTVVTADGKHVTANSIQNTDLFWALRGGGGGTFGVVTSVTIRTYPDVPTIFAVFNINDTTNNATAYWNLVEKFHALLPAVSDAGGSGYYSVIPKSSANPVGSLSSQLFFVNVTDQAATRKVLDAIKAEGQKVMPGLDYVFGPAPYVSQALTQGLTDNGGHSDGLGGIVITGSRLISRKLLETADGPAKLTKALRDIQAIKDTTGYTGHLVAGGQVARNKHISSALNPAWRRALTHIVFGRDWNSTATAEEVLAIRNSMNTVELPILQKLEPDMGAYQNEADPYEVNFQQSFWGDNYPRLYAIKQKVDPKNLFIVRSGVGSEHWDDAGLCRVSK